jgi:murein DD-endopeptidase MepM/ murein hydrolase activator NlpD
MSETKDKKPRKLSLRNISLKKLNRKYDFLMSHDETGRPMLNFRLNLLNLILVVIGMALLLIIITTFIIAFTPLREYIPGYTDTNLNREVYQLNLRADSLSAEMKKRDVYFQNLQRIVEGYDFAADSALAEVNIYEPLPRSATDTIVLKKSSQDSMLRAEFEAQNQYNLFGDNTLCTSKRPVSVKNFFAPVNGSIIKSYNPIGGHFGIDIISTESQIIKATLDGTVVFSTWSIENGYCIGIQHEDGYYSTYKHNATLLKSEGDFVKAGEAIAILGKSGEAQTQTHLHFELWHNGVPLNPSEYMMIENNALGN